MLVFSELFEGNRVLDHPSKLSDMSFSKVFHKSLMNSLYKDSVY